MILALHSGIHANFEALQACMKHAHEQGAQRFAFLGDFVGYGGDPAAVIANLMRYASSGMRRRKKNARLLSHAGRGTIAHRARDGGGCFNSQNKFEALTAS